MFIGHLESSGTEVMMKGPIVRQVCLRRNKESTANEELRLFFSTATFFVVFSLLVH